MTIDPTLIAQLASLYAGQSSAGPALPNAAPSFLPQETDYSKLAEVFGGLSDTNYAAATGSPWGALIDGAMGGAAGYYSGKAGEQEKDKKKKAAELEATNTETRNAVLAKVLSGQQVSTAEMQAALGAGASPGDLRSAGTGGGQQQLRQVFNPSTGKTEYAYPKEGDIVGFSNYGRVNAEAASSEPNGRTARSGPDRGDLSDAAQDIAGLFGDERPQGAAADTPLSKPAAAEAADAAVPRPETSSAPTQRAETDRPAQADALQQGSQTRVAPTQPAATPLGMPGGIAPTLPAAGLSALGEYFLGGASDLPVDDRGMPDPAKMEPGRVYEIPSFGKVRLGPNGGIEKVE